MRSRSASAVAGIAAIALMATACSNDGSDGGDEGAEQSTLVIWSDPERAEAIQSAAAEFAEANGIEVDVQNVSFDDIQGDVVNAHQAGNAPDVFIGAHDWTGNLMRNGAVQPIELPSDRADAIDPTALEAVSLEGQLLGVPYTQENIFLMRNTELAPDAPETFEELVEVGTRLKDDGEVDEVLAMAVGQEGDPYRMNALMSSAGGYLFGQDGNGDWNPDDLGVGTDETIAAMEKIAEYGEEGEGVLRRSIELENEASLFFEGDAPFFVAGPWTIGDANASDIDYEISAIPGFEGMDPASPYIGYQAFFVTEGSANSALAEEFVVNHVTDSDFVLSLYEADPRTPVQTEALESVSADDPNIAVMAETGENGVPMPNIPEMGETWEPLGIAQAQIIGGADAREALETAHDTIAERIGQ
ncbi:sugar ABC transporter substrate-binding protein [Nocardiopsis terrae]|uniref:Arabinogalactan oligomer/maltooligosaccharide transport system substrate-binding protein n=1 Tax=Nocardiopsis terrae TaxID=372655 RepID=A0ABR9HK14_9ACTN|nr:maltose ABC transporter substrate-binding protein [Nocardiopsis terrae]MBE1459361.1 arabinogalactan oligomer/maltooligosaccharide transport system substrate-binding protein [Nocardiopsis terrae]GHC96887.1 sugar ABC transporter substrate-binding protein [Nocardiopsis terrae]